MRPLLLLLFPLLSIVSFASALPDSAPSSPPLPVVQAATTQTCSIYGSGELNCYEGPGESFTAAATVNGGHFYQCSCQKIGENINGNSNWDFIPDNDLPGGGCYVNQYYTTSPCVNSTLPQCS